MKIRVITFVISLCTTVLLTLSIQPLAQAQQQPKLIEFDAPNAGKVYSTTAACQPACGTQAFANNSVGTVVGYYTDKDVVPHAFIRTPDGHITSFDAPGAGTGAFLDQGTVAYSINDLGVIAGLFQDSEYVYHGFVRYPDGFIIGPLDAPGAGTETSTVCKPYCGTYVWNINLEGATSGIYVDSSGVYHGFVRTTGGQVTPFDPLGSIYTFVCEETCLNLEGAITGFYSDASGIIHGFLREPDGKITSFDAPAALATLAASINLEGAITGYFEDSSYVYRGFVRYPDGSFCTFDAPGAGTGAGEGTAAFSINSLGAVTGESFGSNYILQGFVRFPNGTFATFDAPGAGTNAGQGTRPSTNNLEGAVAGWWIDGNGVNHGLVWYPGGVF